MKAHLKEGIKKGVRFTIASEEPVVVMPERVYEELMDLVDVMSDRKLWKRVAAAEKRIKSGKFVLWNDLKRKYGL